MKNIVLILFLTVLIACKPNSEEKSKPVSIKEDVSFLADDKLEGRQTGTKGEKAAADYIAMRFETMGLEAKGTDGYFQQFLFKPKTDPHQEVKYNVKDGDSTITGINVIGFLDNNAKNTIIIGAHYDHLGYGAEGSLYRDKEQQIHNGADDNASGVAVMLNLAQKLKSANTGNNYLFMAFSGEEMGLLGSNYFTKNATIDFQNANYMINMDMVGRLKNNNTLAVYGLGTSPILKQVVKANNANFKIIENESGVGPSDHTSFYLADIPVLHFFTGQHEDYHKPGDDTEKLNIEGMALISGYIFDIISDLDDNGKLPFRKTKNESEDVPRFKVTLGVVPDYLFDGKGMRIDGISEDKPAQKAGLQKGDVVVKLGDSLVTDMMSYMRALSAFDTGDKTKVVVKRGEEEVEAALEF
ncbi:M28 family peptidase [Subsaximicrobium wynnwilliamsii]|uniref:M28 family peptidase n=1 Tax=Subsaximicrobium wynnwilliamsii TaxID=291179 RepID=A0A5C6ZF09_9FLAO|nr:M28 family peptidase [Subsaximicrobium wynnwilliamsii]TXD82682.1 M28 family peptidase [Subsaximicrobium wynnwilliamsii]TXD88417.1 M28 family peptidase [Subsaximicrobium wynnwilliamsii]TXE02344.1 M28 family peptidase [Subsaximicrobium wynnwilliamsii]